MLTQASFRCRHAIFEKFRTSDPGKGDIEAAPRPGAKDNCSRPGKRSVLQH